MRLFDSLPQVFSILAKRMEPGFYLVWIRLRNFLVLRKDNLRNKRSVWLFLKVNMEVIRKSFCVHAWW